MAFYKSLHRYTSRVFYGYWVLLAGSIISIVASVNFYGFAVFFLPVSREFSISRAATSLIFALSRAEGAFEGPIAGWLTDRFGPRLLLLVGAAVVGLGYIVLSQVHSYLGFLLVYMVVISLAYNAGFIHPPLAAVNNWFVRHRGLAMGILMSGHAVGGAFLAPLLALSVHQLGWRPTVVLIGLLVWIVVIPTSLFIRRSPESMGLHPDGVEGRSGHEVVPASQDFTVREALRSPTFWLMVAAVIIRMAAFGTILVHFIPLMVWKGISEQYAAFLLGSLAFFSLPLRILLGWVGDRWSKTKVVSLGMGVGALALLLLLYSYTTWHFWLFIAIFALVEGMASLNWAIVGDFFGRRNFATIRGTMSFFYTWGIVLMPVLAGALYDRTQSYQLVLFILTGLFAFSALLYALLRPPASPKPVEPTGYPK